VPALAESWTVSPDSKTVTFKLRKGVKFHSNANFKPTRDFNADDVLFSWSRMADDNNPFHKITAGQTYAYFEDMGMKNIVDRVEKVDDYTVRFTLKRPEAPFLADMAMDFASILSKEYFETMQKKGTPNAADVYPIGTGPFELSPIKGRDHSLQGSIITFAASRRSTRWSIRSPRRHGALRQAEDRRVPRDGVSKAGGFSGDEGRPGIECAARKASTSATSRSTPRRNPSTTRWCGRLNMAIDKESILSRCTRDKARSPNPIPPILSYNNNSRIIHSISRRRRTCSPRPVIRTALKSICGICR
jgi:dipeptide transport system substrate-binding protein